MLRCARRAATDACCIAPGGHRSGERLPKPLVQNVRHCANCKKYVYLLYNAYCDYCQALARRPGGHSCP